MVIWGVDRHSVWFLLGNLLLLPWYIGPHCFSPRFNIKSLFHLALCTAILCCYVFVCYHHHGHPLSQFYVNVVQSILCKLSHCILFSLYFVWSHSFSPFAFLGVCCPAFFQVIRITVSSFHWLLIISWCSVISCECLCDAVSGRLGAIDVICNLWMQAMNAIFCISCHCAICRGVVCSFCMHWKVVFGVVVVFVEDHNT